MIYSNVQTNESKRGTTAHSKYRNKREGNHNQHHRSPINGHHGTAINHPDPWRAAAAIGGIEIGGAAIDCVRTESVNEMMTAPNAG